ICRINNTKFFKMKIIFFVQNLNSGGIENYLLRFLKIYNNSFDQVYVWCKSKNLGDQLEAEYKSMSNVAIVKMPLTYLSINNYKKLALFIKQNDVNVVCDFTGNFAGLVVLTSFLAGVRKRVTFYRSSSDHFKGNLINNSYNFLINRVTKWFSTDLLGNSIAGLDYFFGRQWRNNSKFEVIYNDVNVANLLTENESLHKELHIPIGSFVVGHIGRFNSAKNHRTILSVARKM